jgi:hypothetical protein
MIRIPLFLRKIVIGNFVGFPDAHPKNTVGLGQADRIEILFCPLHLYGH